MKEYRKPRAIVNLREETEVRRQKSEWKGRISAACVTEPRPEGSGGVHPHNFHSAHSGYVASESVLHFTPPLPPGRGSVTHYRLSSGKRSGCSMDSTDRTIHNQETPNVAVRHFHLLPGIGRIAGVESCVMKWINSCGMLLARIMTHVSELAIGDSTIHNQETPNVAACANPFFMDRHAGPERPRRRLKFRNESRPWTVCFSLMMVAEIVQLLLVPNLAAAQLPPSSSTGTHGQRTLNARRTELAVRIDGELNEEAWGQAAVSLNFTQQEPREGEPSSERTDLLVLYTTTTLYIGVICHDSDPSAIRATERRRDDGFGEDDRVSVILDTFHDHRSAFLFRTNPLGAQYDALISDEGKSVNANWDEKWEVAAQTNEAGWTVEFAIPFRSLRGGESSGHAWGIDVERIIRRKNELTYWNNYRRGFQLENVSQAGHLNGLEGIDTGLRWRVKPYLLGGFRQTVRRDAAVPGRFDSAFRDASDAGIEVLKYRITPSLTVDMTWNTDFAQAEVDTLQNNLERFQLFFPETREFFQEGSGVFAFGTAQRESDRELTIFHSRSIGRSPRGTVVPIRAGGRVTGRVSGLTLGLLNMQTASLQTSAENIPASNFSVLRAKQDVLARSSVGAFWVNREYGGSPDYSRVFGVDGRFVFLRYLTLDGFLARSGEPSGITDTWASSFNGKWDSDRLFAALESYSIDPNFRDDMGFVLRRDVRRTTPSLGFRPRPGVWGIRQMDVSSRFDYYTNHAGHLVERINHYTLLITLESGDSLRFAGHVYLDRPRNNFEIKPGVVIPAGDYTWNTWSATYRGSSSRRLSGLVQFVMLSDYYDGKALDLKLNPTWKLTTSLSLSADYRIVDASLPYGDFTDHTLNARVNYSFNNQWLTSTIVQYDRATSFFGFNFRLNYIYRPGSDLFLIYNETRQAGGLRDGEKDRSLQTKLTYSFDF
ncbi:MAG: hypothetical protein EXQ56_03660 [Acidobacteria bacterium]|nr:hypothetical protein [Acidobacteriota bacterium]